MDQNPYLSPSKIAPLAVVSIPSADDPQISFRLERMEKTWVTRTAFFEGDFSGTVTYDSKGFGFESVFVNSQQTKITSNNPFSLALVVPVVDFKIPCKGIEIPARIDVKCGYLQFWRLCYFRLSINGQLVYSEPL